MKANRRSSRAQSRLAAFLPQLARRIWQTARGIWRTCVKIRRWHANYHVLQRLTDASLSDIGLSRSEVPAALDLLIVDGVADPIPRLRAARKLELVQPGQTEARQR